MSIGAVAAVVIGVAATVGAIAGLSARARRRRSGGTYSVSLGLPVRSLWAVAIVAALFAGWGFGTGHVVVGIAAVVVAVAALEYGALALRKRKL